MSQALVEQLFNNILGLHPDQRWQELNKYCGSNRSLFEEVKSLLLASEKAKGFLSKSPFASDPVEPLDTTPYLNKRIGAYQLTSELGQGGMGAVFLANRVDGLYQQQVAIKLLHNNFLTKSQLRLFYTERQILAKLQHDNIARLLDGGSTPEGQPYLVMEYIEGCNIDEYCTKHSLSLKEKLLIFCVVCDAVQYAHNRLIVHRDLKPENVLITSEGIPKLVDFGIAKLLSSDKTKSNTTIAQGLAMTPEYAAPEQLNGGSISTATDVYSLGVILYKLLSGNLPYSFSNQSLLNMVENICAKDIIKPSRSITAKYHERVKGDLDKITLHALNKDANDRYQTAQQFAEDIERYLLGHPIKASHTTCYYKIVKFLRRHFIILGLITSTIIFLILGVVSSYWQWTIAQQQTIRAETRYSEVRDLLNTFVLEFSDAIKTMPGSTKFRQSMILKARVYLDKLAAEYNNDANLMRDVATAYHQLATIQGNPIFQNLGDTFSALKTYQKSLLIRKQLYNNAPKDPLFSLDLAESYRVISAIYATLDDIDKAIEYTTNCLDLFEPIEVIESEKIVVKKIQCALANAHWHNLNNDSASALHVLLQVHLIYDQSSNKLPGSLNKFLSRLNEELAEAYANANKPIDALYYSLRFLALTQFTLKINPLTAQQAHAYRALAKRFMSIGEFTSSENNFIKSLNQYKTRLSAFPDDIRYLRALAGINAEIAFFYTSKADNNKLRKSKKDYLELSCKHYNLSRTYFDRIPDKHVGYGVRHFNVPTPAQLNDTFNKVCPKL